MAVQEVHDLHRAIFVNVTNYLYTKVKGQVLHHYGGKKHIFFLITAWNTWICLNIVGLQYNQPQTSEKTASKIKT